MKSKLIVYLFLIISLSLYSPNSALSKLKLLYPNGSEKISYDKPIDIIWEGVDSSESVTIEFSWNNGTSWNLISNDAKGLRYNWSNIPFENSKDCLIRLRSNIFWDSTNTNFNEIAYQKQGTFNILGWEQESSKLITLSQVTNSTLSHFDTSSKKLNVIKNNLEYYADCTISPDNKKIIGVNTFGRYGIYDAITGATICSFNSKLNSKYNIAGNFFAWSPDCKYVAIAATIYDDNKVIYIHKTDTGELFDSLKPDFNAKFHGFNLLQLSWSNDNKFIRFATSSSVYTWSTNFVFISEESFYALLKNYNEADNWDVRISPDGKYVGLIDYKNTLSIYDLIEKKMKKILNLKNISKNAFTSFRWNHLSNRISFFSRDSVTNLDIYDLDKDTVYIDSPLISTINDIVWSTTGVSLKNFEEKWGKGTKILTFNIDSLNDNCSSYPNIRYSPNGKYIAFLGLNRQYKIINSNDGELVLSIYANPLTYKSNYYTSNDFAWHPDNDKIIINADSGNLDIYSISQRKRIKRIANIYTFFPTLPAAKYYVPTLFEFSSDGKYILAGFDEAIIVIDFETGKLVKSILNSPNLARSIYNLKWDYEHNHLAVSYYDNNIHKYFIEVMEFDMNKNQGTEFNGPLYTRLLKQQVDKNFYSLCNYYFLPDGGFIYKTLESITKYDKNFKKISSILLDNNDKFPIENQLSTDFNLMISSLRFDNKSVLNGYESDNIKIYNPKTGKLLGILKDKINDVHDGFSVSWHPNSKQIAIGNIYGLKVYNLNYSYLNEDISDNVFTIQAPKLTFNNINLVNCYDSETSDTTLSNFIINDGDIPFVIDTAFSHSSLYSNSVQIINETFPIIIPPHQSKSLKVRFKISNKSDAIFAFGNKFKLLTLIFSVTKRGVNVVYLEKIDFGKVPVKSTKNINLSKEIYNQSPKDLTISSTYFEDCIETNFKMETFFPLTIPSYKKIVGNYDLSFTPITKGIKTCILNNIIKEDPLCSMKFILTGEGIETNDIDEEVKSKNEYEIELIDNILKIQNIKGYYLKIDLVDITGRTLFAEKITNTQYFEKELNVNLKNIFLYLRIQNENSVKIYSILGEVLNELNK